MRIIHFLENYANVGGAETYAHQLIGWLEREGHDNIVVYATAHPAERQYPASRGFHVPQPPYPAPIVDAQAQISRIIAAEQPDVAFVHHVYHPGIVEFVICNLPAIGYVQGPYLFCPGHRQYLPGAEQVCPHTAGSICLLNGQIQGCIWGRNPLTHWRLLRRTLDFLVVYRRLHRIIVGSAFMQNMLERNGLPADKIVISPTFLLEPGAQQPPSFSTAESPTILFSGRIVREKGLHHLLAALRTISTPWQLVVAGAGPDESYCQELAVRYGIADQVVFRGWVDPKDAEELLEECALLAMPSLWPEPFGRVGPEAFVHGKPVVAYATGGIPDWLHDGVNGLLVPAGDITMLRQAIAQLLNDGAFRRQLGQQAYTGVLVDYASSKHLPAVAALLRQAIQERSIR